MLADLSHSWAVGKQANEGFLDVAWLQLEVDLHHTVFCLRDCLITIHEDGGMLMKHHLGGKGSTPACSHPCAGVSLVVIRCHVLAAPDSLEKDLLAEDTNNSFRVLEIALTMLSRLSFSTEASPLLSISIPSDLMLSLSSFSASRAIKDVPWGRAALLPRLVGVAAVAAAVAISPVTSNFLLLWVDPFKIETGFVSVKPDLAPL